MHKPNPEKPWKTSKNIGKPRKTHRRTVKKEKQTRRTHRRRPRETRPDAECRQTPPPSRAGDHVVSTGAGWGARGRLRKARASTWLSKSARNGAYLVGSSAAWAACVWLRSWRRGARPGPPPSTKLARRACGRARAWPGSAQQATIGRGAVATFGPPMPYSHTWSS